MLTYKSSWYVVSQEGMIALWRGWVPSVLGVIPYVGLNFSVYETLKDVVLKHYGGSCKFSNCLHPLHCWDLRTVGSLQYVGCVLKQQAATAAAAAADIQSSFKYL